METLKKCAIFVFLICAQANGIEQNICSNGKMINCKLNDQLSEIIDSEQIEKKITSIFDENVNYSANWNDRKNQNDFNVDNNLRINNDIQNLSKIIANENDQEDDAANNDLEYMTTLANKFIAFAQPFDASKNPSASETCKRQTAKFLKSLQNFIPWALEMHDASGKLSSGILNGNINQHGDFDQCLNVLSKSDNIQGQYCLAYMQPTISYESKRMKEIFKRIQSHSAFKTDFNDPGHRVPRFNLINWGLCVPSSCTPQDVEYSVREYLTNFTIGTGLTFQMRVEPSMCQVQNTLVLDANTKLAVIFFAGIVAVTVLSTLYDVTTKINGQDSWLTAFSLKKNGKWLFGTKSSPDDIETVHGIRFMNALMLLFSHKSMAVFFNPYNNRTYLAESLGQQWTVIGRAASLYTDPFLLFSGMLTSYSLFGRLMKGRPIQLKNEYIGRLIRIVPSLAALILFCTFILPLMGSGPQWNLVVGHHSTLCKKNWWRNLLFIHNYFGFSEMCLTHTHHLGIDTELFAVAPLMILGLWKWPRKGLGVLIGLCALGTFARYYTTIVHQLSNYVYFGTSTKRLFLTADKMYSFPPYRSTVYIMGVLLGYGLRKFPQVKLSSVQLTIGWTIGVGLFLGSTLGPAPMGHISYEYKPMHAAIYAALAPIAWCSFFAWTVFVSHKGYTNLFTRMLSWRGFQISTKLSYAIYLTQFPVFFFNVGRRRHTHHYYNFVSLLLDLNELACIVIASILLTLLFDAPFQNVKKLVFNRLSLSRPSVRNYSSLDQNEKIFDENKNLKSPSEKLHLN